MNHKWSVILMMNFCFTWSLNAYAETQFKTNFSSLKSLNTLNSPQKAEPRAKKLVVFWATWCGSCKEKLTNILPEWRLKNKLDIMVVSIDKNADRAKHFVDKHSITLPAFIDHNEYFQKNLKVQSVPYWAIFEKEPDSSDWILITDGKGFDEVKILSGMAMKPPVLG